MKVEPLSPIHSSPDKNSPSIAVIDNEVIFEGEVANDYVMIYAKGQYGYINKMWVNVEGTRRLLKSSKYIGLVGKQVIVFLYSPIYQIASTDSKIVANADDKKVLIMEDINEDYFLSDIIMLKDICQTTT